MRKKMSMLKQVSLLSAGCQPWNRDVCACTQDRFAYCSTLATYVYKLHDQYGKFKLSSIICEHKKTITSIAWNPHNTDMLASSGADNTLLVFNIADQRVVATAENTKGIPVCLGWSPHEKDTVGFIHAQGPLFQWRFGSETASVLPLRDTAGFQYNVTVFRYHHKKPGRIAFGHVDGSISICNSGSKSHKHILRNIENVSSGEQEWDPIHDIRWDPLSNDYLLVANLRCGLQLVDVNTLTQVMKFVLPSAASQISSMAWLSSAPGMFVTGDVQVGLLRIWTVSKATPLESIKLKKTGFHALCVFSYDVSIASDQRQHKYKDNYASSTSEVPTSPSTPTMSYMPPSGHAVCAFLDGGIGLYDLRKRKWDFLRDQGHIETIFDCKFKPDNSDLLATASFDGTIKIWDVNAMNSVDTSPGNEGIIYHLSWAPADLNCIAAATAKNGCFIWDIGKSKVIQRFVEHGKFPVYCIAWNYKDPRRIASCGGDGSCIIRQVDGKILARYKHPASVFGCDWSDHNKDMLATACDDKCVRVFYTVGLSEQPVRTFTGHSAKVFGVKWSPIREALLCSGSDDMTVRIWDYTQESCIQILAGHTGPVRGLLWNPEIPHLLISGSWDYTIRVWDIRDGNCIDTVKDHAADVYGLTCHPSRPFIMASSSRDSTVRLWSLCPLVEPLEINVIAGRPFSEIVTAADSVHDMVGNTGGPPLLCGSISKSMRAELDTKTPDRLRILQKFSQYFSPPGGATNLWNLVDVITDNPEIAMNDHYGKGILHMKHLTKFRASKAQELEMVKVARYGSGGIGTQSREDRFREAANIYMQLGNMRRYCEMLVGLGEWEKALSVAPGVSMEYWQSLAKRRAEDLKEQDSEEAIPYYIALGDGKEVVDYYLSHSQFDKAMLTAAVAHEGSISTPCAYKMQQRNDESPNNVTYSKLLHETADSLADSYFQDGSPTLAACCHLAVNDFEKALSKLIRGNELELAVSIGIVLDKAPQLIALALEYLSRRCERLTKCIPPFDHREMAVKLLKTSQYTEDALVKLCARCPASSAERDDLHKQAGLPSLDKCLEIAQQLQHSKSDIVECVKHFVLSSSPETGLEVGLQFIKDELWLPDWTVNKVWDVITLLGCISSNKLNLPKCAKLKEELLVLSSYIGALVAIRREYYIIVPALFYCAKHILQRNENLSFSVPVDVPLLDSESNAFCAHHRVNYGRADVLEKKSSEDQEKIYKQLLRKAGKEPNPLNVGTDIVSSSHLPSLSDVQVSYILGTRIQGPVFFLEDGRSAVSLNEALMWAKVNAFSPLGSTVHINPF